MMSSIPEGNMASRCTVVVCTTARDSVLRECLAALRGGTAARVVVVDNTAGDHTTQEAAREHGCDYLLVSTPGLSRARNQAAAACDSEFIAFIDDDALPQPDWLPELLRGFSDERTAAVSGRILPRKVETEAEKRFAALGGFDLGEQPRSLDARNPQWLDTALFQPLGNGSNLAFRREAFRACGGFDERLGAGAQIPAGEERRLFLALLEAGYRIEYAPKAVVRHPFPVTMEELRERERLHAGAAIAGAALLMAERPEYRARLRKYYWSRLLRRGTRPGSPGAPTTLARGAMLRAAVRGLVMYLGARRRGGSGSAPSRSSQSARAAAARQG